LLLDMTKALDDLSRGIVDQLLHDGLVLGRRIANRLPSGLGSVREMLFHGT